MTRHEIELMFYKNKENGITITSMRIDNETKKLVEVMRQYIKAVNPDVYTSDNSIIKKALYNNIKKHDLDYLLDDKLKDKMTKTRIKMLDNIISDNYDFNWKVKKDRIDNCIDSDIKDGMKELGLHLFEKKEFNHKPTYDEILLYLLSYYSEQNKDFVNPNIRSKYIIRQEKIKQCQENKNI